MVFNAHNQSKLKDCKFDWKYQNWESIAGCCQCNIEWGRYRTD